MGCGGSRFDKRNKASNDYNTVGVQFVGGEANTPDCCPFDKIVVQAGDEGLAKYKVDGTKCTDEDFAKEVATSLHKVMKAHLDKLQDKHGNPQDSKEVVIEDKYLWPDVEAQLKAVLAGLKECGATVEEEPAMEMEEKAMDEDAPEEMMMEGEGEMMMELAPVAAWNPYEGDGGDYSGAGNLPAFLLSASCKQPYFGDMLRRAMIEWEFNFEDKPDNKDFENACGMMAAAAESGSAKKEVWIAGCHGEEDWGAVQGMLADKDNAEIMFPGAIACWTSEENAKKALEGAGERGSGLQKVLYKVEATGLEAVHCRFFAHRLSAKFGDAQDDVDNKTQIINLTALEGDDALKAKMGTTLPEWREKVEEARKAAEAAAAAAAAAPEEAPAMEGEGMMDGEAMMEGEAAAE